MTREKFLVWGAARLSGPRLSPRRPRRQPPRPGKAPTGAAQQPDGTFPAAGLRAGEMRGIWPLGWLSRSPPRPQQLPKGVRNVQRGCCGGRNNAFGRRWPPRGDPLGLAPGDGGRTSVRAREPQRRSGSEILLWGFLSL